MSASAQEFEKVDSLIDYYPRSFLNTEKLALRICTDFKDQTQQARAIYAWIGKNIEYDVKAFYSKKKSKNISYKSEEERQRKEAKLQNRISNQTFRKKKAVCYGYSVLYKKICDMCEIHCKVITGGDKTQFSQIDKKPSRRSHAWNSVYVNDSWKLIDVTWAAGAVDKKTKKFIPGYSDSYFFLSPEKFFLNHFPKDTSWILTNKTKDEFVKLPLYHSSYISSDISITNPMEGVVYVSENDTINFTILNLPTSSSVSYRYKNEKNGYIVNPKYHNPSYCEFGIINHLPRDGYLTIFIDSKPISTYKIKNTIK